LIRTQRTQRFLKMSSSKTKYLVFDVLFHEWIFLWLLGRESTIEQACLKVFGLMGLMPLVGVLLIYFYCVQESTLKIFRLRTMNKMVKMLEVTTICRGPQWHVWMNQQMLKGILCKDWLGFLRPK
jgi:hypothetical protein